MVAASGLVILSDSSNAMTSDGTEHGTSDSPLTGLSGDVTDFDGTYYVAVGSPVEILGVCDFDTGFNHVITHVTEGFGLTIEEYGPGAPVYKIVGSVSKAGEIRVNVMSEGSIGAPDYRDFTLMAVESRSGDGIEFTSASTVHGISGDSITYTATTNFVSTFSELGGTAALWLDIDPTTGKVTGTLPTIESVTTYTYEIQAVSVDDQSKIATLTLTITVTPALEFLSDPAEGAMALIGSQMQSKYHPMHVQE